MHYRHAYHAGNFADVHKHVVLVGLLQALSRKDAGWSYLETHAGAGDYDLQSVAANTTAEWQDGIGQLRRDWAVPEPLAGFLREVMAINPPEGPWRHYPGSPALTAALAREQDRLVLCERVPEVMEQLRDRFRGDDRITLHARDGYEAHALLPPREKRGLVLVDPPFERRDEFAAMTEFLTRAQARFAGGIYAFWYPLKNTHEVERFVRRMGQASTRPVLDCRFDTGADAEGQMRGAGMLIVNPPYQLAETLAPALDLLAQQLAQGRRAVSTLTWVRTESSH